MHPFWFIVVIISIISGIWILVNGILRRRQTEQGDFIDAKSIKMNFDRFVTSGILWITLGGDVGPAWVGLQSKCLRKWSPSLLSSHLMILIAESTMWDCKTNAWRKQRQYEHDIKVLIAVKFLTDRKLPWRSSGWVGRCATDRWSEDGALFLPTTGLQLQYDMPTPARVPATQLCLRFTTPWNALPMSLPPWRQHLYQ